MEIVPIPFPSRSLLDKIVSGDEAAFTIVFHHYRKKVYSIAFRITRSSLHAEEILQEVFLKIWEKRMLLADVSQFENYLFILTRNTVFSYLRAIAVRESNVIVKDQLPESVQQIEHDPFIEKELRNIMHAAISHLPAQQKEVYRLIKQQGLKRSEAARQLGIKPNTVKAHLSSAIRNIRAFCTSHLDYHTIIILSVCGYYLPI